MAGGSPQMLMQAPVINHTDAELILLESLVGRQPPFIGRVPVFFGDDVTYEQAVRRLRGDDVGVKVGPGDTLAGFRVGVPTDVSDALELLLAERAGFVESDRR